MNKVLGLAKTIGVWLFVAFCLIIALGSGGGVGSILMIVPAILAIPIKPIRSLWSKLLNSTDSKSQKKRKALKPLSIAIVFIIAFALCMSQVEPTSNIENLSLENNPVISEEFTSDDDLITTPTEITVPVAPVESTPETDTKTETETTSPSVEDVDITHPAETTEPEPPQEDTVLPEPEQPAVNSTFSIHFIDVGQADAALIECDGHYMLIDGGNKADSNVIYSVLKKAAVSKLDIVVGTHAHEDHIGGLPGAFNYTTADLTLCPVTTYDSDAFEDFKTYADKNGGGITIPSVGDQYKIGSATIEILGVNGGSDANNSSIVLMITYGSTKFLFTGDAEREAEQAILNRGVDLSCVVLKVGHHGSDTSTTYPFLREIMPKYAIISVGEGNSYGHPTDDTLSRLRDADVTVYRTDLNGDIYLTSDGQTVSISTDKSASNDDILTPGGTSTPPAVSEPDPEENTSSSGTDYIVNTNTGKFHYPSCSSVKRMKESNKMYYTGTRDELIAKGYSPCGNCHP